MAMTRTILHVDMDAFFASVEQLDDPSLRGKPVLVGYDGPRGVVAAASYESRVFGCRSAQPMAVAKRLCPHAVIVPVHFSRYRQVSAAIFQIFESYTPAIEPLSVDEAFLDLTGCERLLGDAVGVGRDLKDRIRRETGLTASVGIAPNKFLAKLASDLEKPDGLTIVRAEDALQLLDPMPVGKLWGVGPKTVNRLETVGIKTVGDIRRAAPDVLARRLGDDAEHFRRLAMGLDDRPVVYDREAKSIGQEQTFGVDLADRESLLGVMLEQSEQVACRLRRHKLQARSVTVKIRFGNFQTITRQATLEQPTDTTAGVWNAARELFERWASEQFHPVRLIGVCATNFEAGGGQLQLFANPDTQKQQAIDKAVDRIHARFGAGVIGRAGGKLRKG